jgi:RNA polymerase sigma-70 factor (ECF subfamily)
MDWLSLRYREIEKRLRRLLRRQGRTREDAEDLIQESLLRLHEYTRSSTVSNNSAFLARTVRNLSIDRYRREHRHLYALETVEELEQNDVLQDEGPAPDDIVSSQRRLQKVESILRAVSPRTCDIYFAHRAGYSYTEIGEQLRVSKSTIEKHIARAVLALMDAKEPE